MFACSFMCDASDVTVNGCIACTGPTMWEFTIPEECWQAVAGPSVQECMLCIVK